RRHSRAADFRFLVVADRIGSILRHRLPARVADRKPNRRTAAAGYRRSAESAQDHRIDRLGDLGCDRDASTWIFCGSPIAIGRIDFWRVWPIRAAEYCPAGL